MTSKEAYRYPVYMEAKVQLSGAFLANDVWLLSADETQEIDFLETYPSEDTALAWFDQRIHISNHVFIRSPFQDYQPKDEEEVFGTWYWEEDRETWRGDWVTVGVYWRDPWHLEYYVNGKWVRTMDKKSYSYKDHTGEIVEHTREFNVIDKYNYTNGTGLNKPMHIIINMEQQQWHSDANRFPPREDLEDANNKNIMWVDWIRLYKAVEGVPITTPEAITPTKVRLFQNYPNPCNATTTIRFTIPETVKIRLAVFDASGEEVALLVSGLKDAGTHTVTFDVSQLNSGVHFYRLETDSQVLTKKIMFVK
jgi:hypothetical protein